MNPKLNQSEPPTRHYRLYRTSHQCHYSLSHYLITHRVSCTKIQDNLVQPRRKQVTNKQTDKQEKCKHLFRLIQRCKTEMHLLSVRNGPNLQSYLFRAYLSLNPSRVKQNYITQLHIYIKKWLKLFIETRNVNFKLIIRCENQFFL